MSFEDLHSPFPPPPLPPTVTTLEQAKKILAADERRQFMELLAKMNADQFEFSFGLQDPDDHHRQMMQKIYLLVDGTWQFVDG